MPLVNGTLTDFGLDPLTAADPLLQFRASSAGISGLNILAASPPVEVVPAANGFFEIDLADTYSLDSGGVTYSITVQYREARTGYIKRELLPWRLQVPADGGALADLIQYPTNPAAVWVGTEPPVDEPTPGTWWLNPETGELTEWSN